MARSSQASRYAAMDRLTSFVESQFAAGKSFDEVWAEARGMRSSGIQVGGDTPRRIQLSEEDFLRAFTDGHQRAEQRKA